ncbi:hypothetical protein P4N68_13115 [Corynebacterium felinum]|uniref:Secreted protein n=1 Tax=Corynebacterium felinum TaxID=131318 RepID=A0ABU2B978_9CORY|nr:hypothetical protein [Corynebacterium felinum]MDF5822009.1 hypothetical protein [Corynebacterium felinum]MDR7355179.1 hypothetical protein [Corynebacterium felinum]WJY94530.1 hypothetical protein CFELI_04500 [Corynebacterium felinum]
MEITVGAVLIVVCFVIAAGAGYFAALRHGDVSRIRIAVDVPPESTCTETSSLDDNTPATDNKKPTSALPAHSGQAPSADSTSTPARPPKPTPKAMPKRRSVGYSKPHTPSQAQYTRDIELVLPNYDIDPAELLTQLDTIEPIRLPNNRWEYHLNTVTVQLNPQGSLVMSITPTDRK